jgi:hypothetical protein
VETLDHFCEEHDIHGIDILKSDAEGYDLEVLNGSKEMLQSGGVKIVYLEVNFADKFLGQGSFGQAFELLDRCGFRSASFYEVFRERDVAVWTDALFVHRSVVGL